MTQFDKRLKFFYANPVMFPEWLGASRNAIGVNLDDPRRKSTDVWFFIVKDKKYSITREKAEIWGRKYIVPGNQPMPHLIPIEQFNTV